MKNLSYILTVFTSLVSSVMFGQTLDDAIRFNQRELTGTARSLSMANAFGALGGDLSAISINPAGIAVYRTSEFAFTPSLSVNHNKASTSLFTTREDDFSFPLNQIGGVTTNRTLREKSEGLISTHFGFTYNRTADFNTKTTARLRTGVRDEYDETGYPSSMNTLLTNILWEANGYTPDFMSNRAYFAYNTYLLNPVYIPEDGSDPTEFYSEYEAKDDDLLTIYDRNGNGIDQNFLIETSGYSGEYGLTFGANISNVFLLGVAINFQSFKYEERQSFREINTYGFDPMNYDEYGRVIDLDYYDAYTQLNQSGFGVNGKIGMILNLNPIRIGASFHTPTFYGIDEDYWDGIESFYLNYDRFKSESDVYTWSYNYRSPYRAQGSLAFVLGKIGLLSFDYEMTDHKSSRISSANGFSVSFDELNQEIKDNFKITHDIKAGIEIKPVPFIALRGGAAYFDSPFKDKSIDLSKWMYTAGIGIRGKAMFFDVAYAQTRYDDTFYLNTDGSIWQGVSYADPIKLSNIRHQASFTLGFKF